MYPRATGIAPPVMVWHTILVISQFITVFGNYRCVVWQSNEQAAAGGHGLSRRNLLKYPRDCQLKLFDIISIKKQIKQETLSSMWYYLIICCAPISKTAVGERGDSRLQSNAWARPKGIVWNFKQIFMHYETINICPLWSFYVVSVNVLLLLLLMSQC